MDQFDAKIKQDAKNYLQQNVHFTRENRNNINESIAKKRTPFLITGLTTVMLAIAIVVMIGLPVWLQSQNNVVLQQTIASISEINLTLKNKLPDDFLPVVEPEEPEKTEEQEETEQPEQNEPVETEQNEEQSDNEVETNEESPSQSNEEEPEETEESTSTEQGTEEEETNTETEEEQSVDEAVFIDLVKKYNAMGDDIILEEGSYKIENYQSKEEYYNYLSSFMTYETAKELWHYRLKNVEGGLELIAMDGHEDFSLEEGYTFGQYSDTEYYINRYQESDLFGGTDMTINFTLREGTWVISDIIRK
ncbi:hypothetical protein [Gracilibacillus salinarum]|uniref:Uncharacterized protein n=1 Tax=Gracilibacillus salinarum TaxID=2932255 RepID=A0ABY4GRD1_9BACI|nr:hypothetical protein [Gracilibacillus salinarum]UOQ86951.1 hypothetical protein MUN87_08740 [Gracilibacillus salinarum]